MPANKKTTTKKVSRKKVTKKATFKQRKTLEIALENNGNLSAAMREAGYSPATAKNPHLLKESDGWQSLMKGLGIDDAALIRKNNQLMETAKLDEYEFDGDMDDNEIKDVFAEIPGVKVVHIKYQKEKYLVKVGKKNIEKTRIAKKIAYLKVPDVTSQEKALDKFMKIRGAYKTEEAPGQVNQINLLLQSKKESYGI
jgi:hypothetical protein